MFELINVFDTFSMFDGYQCTTATPALLAVGIALCIASTLSYIPQYYSLLKSSPGVELMKSLTESLF